VFCVAFLLATAAVASPISSDEGEVVENEIVAEEPELEGEQKFEAIQSFSDDVEAVEVEEPAPVVDEQTVEVVNETPVEEEAAQVDEQVNEVEVINEPSNELGVPYEEENEDEDEAKALQTEDEEDIPELTPEQMEKTFGIEIPMCSQHTDDRVALHLR
jgi:hypothetical protein